MIFNQINNLRRYVKACDYSNLITTLSGGSLAKTWTATKDCWLVGRCHAYANNNYNGSLSINGNYVINTSPTEKISFCLYVTKGTAVTYYGTTNISVFGCL